MRVLIAGYYGFGNAGDEAILATVLADLRALEPALLATVVAEDTRATSAYGVATVHWKDVPGIAAAVQEADLVILGGGGLFQDSLAFDPAAILTPRHHGISYYSGFPLLAAAFGKPCAMYAVGVGPLTTDAGRAGTRAAFERADVVTVRDAASKAALVALGIDADRIHVTADPAYRLPRASEARAEEILQMAGLDIGLRPRLGVALRHWDIGVDPARWEEQVALALDEFLLRYDGVAVFVPFQALREDLVNDVAAAHRVRARMRHATRTVVLDGSQSPSEKAAVLGSCDVVLGMRLHSLVFAMSAGVAAVALAYDPKVRVAMVAAGAPERVIEIAGVTADALAAALSTTYTQRAAVGQRLGIAAARLRESALENARLALRLTRGPSLGAQLRALFASPRWVLHHRLRVALAPPGTRRERAWRLARRGLRTRTVGGHENAAAHVRDQPLDALAARIEASRGAVIFPPSIGWKVDLVQRPHHLSRAFARAGYIAVFDSSNSHDKVEGFQEIEPGVVLYGGPHEVLGRLRRATLWTFPYNFHLREHHPPDTPVVYDWIDDLSVFPQERSLLDRNHRAALKEATVFASVARTLDAEARRVRPDALYLPNAVEFDRFAREEAPAPLVDPALSDLLSAGRPIAGYYGAMARWFDYELLDEVSRLRPDWSFLLIGPDHDDSLAGQPALARPNVAWIGPRPYETLPRYLRLFDVATIPFQINAITLSTSPLKLFEYFAGGKPVVTTPMPECMAFPEVRIAATAPEFARALDEARQDGVDAAFRARLRAAGRANSWDARVQHVVAALARSARPRGAGLY